MKARKISNTVTWLGAIDWDRRLFDALIPLPDGTTYNAYLVRGDSKTALIDTVDSSMAHVLLRQLEDVPKVDYVISNHAEKDHSGAIPEVLKRYPEATLLTSDRAVNVLVDSLKIDPDRIRVVKDSETVDLGGGKSVEALAGMIPNLKVEVVEPYLTKGSPDQIDCDAIDKLASAIAERHASL